MSDLASGWFFDYATKIDYKADSIGVVDDQLFVSTNQTIRYYNVWGSVDKDLLATKELLDIERNENLYCDFYKDDFREPVLLGSFDLPEQIIVNNIASSINKIFLASDKLGRIIPNESTLTSVEEIPTELSLNGELVLCSEDLHLYVSDPSYVKTGHDTYWRDIGLLNTTLTGKTVYSLSVLPDLHILGNTEENISDYVVGDLAIVPFDDYTLCIYECVQSSEFYYNTIKKTGDQVYTVPPFSVFYNMWLKRETLATEAPTTIGLALKKDLSNSNDALDISNWEVFEKCMHSNIVHAYGALWMVTSKDENNDQFLYRFEESNNNYCSQGITYNYFKRFSKAKFETPGQDIPNKLIDGQNGNIYVARYNGSVDKFNGYTGAYEKSIRVHSRPQAMVVDSEGYINVSGVSGYCSKIDRQTDEATAGPTFISEVGGMVDVNDGYLWAISIAKNGFTRMSKTQVTSGGVTGYQSLITKTGFNAPGVIDYLIEDGSFSGNVNFKFIDSIRQNKMYYIDSDNDIQYSVVYPRIILANNSKVWIIRPYGLMYRTPYARLGAYGYITTGETDYSG